jgi:hypothetical protein
LSGQLTSKGKQQKICLSIASSLVFGVPTREVVAQASGLQGSIASEFSATFPLMAAAAAAAALSGG